MRQGLDRALDIITRFMRLTAGYEPLRGFAEREPALALRVLLKSDGPVAKELRTGFARALDTHLGSRSVVRLGGRCLGSRAAAAVRR